MDYDGRMPMRGRCFVSALLAGLVVVGLPGAAGAQVHWDASAQAGGIKRWLADRPSGGADATFGGQAQLAAHVALLPLVRAGVYGAFDVTGAGDATRFFAGGGPHVKIFAPLPGGAPRVWLGTGFGVIGATSPTYRANVVVPATAGGTMAVDADVASAGGHFFEVPIALGASAKVWGPWSLMAELGLRWGFGHGGSLWGGRGYGLDSRGAVGLVDPAYRIPSPGVDRFALGLTVGVLYDH